MWYGHVNGRSHKDELLKKTQKHLFSTVASSLDMLSHTVELKQYNSAGITSMPDPMGSW